MKDLRKFLPTLVFFAVPVGLILLVLIPVPSVISARSPRTKALAHSKQLWLALDEYAFDHDGNFPAPGPEGDSNSAFRQLFDRKFQDERIFFVPGSAWHDSLPEGQTKPDNDVGEPPAYELGLERGENHWAYVSGLNSESKGSLPLIVDGFMAGQPGTYSEDPGQRGGVWEREAAIIVRVDGSAKMEKPRKTKGKTGLRIFKKINGRKVDVFSKEFGTQPQNIHNPLP